MIAAGQEPFPVIKARFDLLAPGEELRLITPFLPSPLIELAREAGFEVRPMRGSAGSWETVFYRTPAKKFRRVDEHQGM